MDSSLKKSFTIKKINLFSSWVHNLKKNTECTICRCHLNVPSLYNQEKGIDSIVLSGICNHSYHEECINPWIKTNNYCPICFQKWEFVKQDKLIETVIGSEYKKPKFVDPDMKKYKKYEYMENYIKDDIKDIIIEKDYIKDDIKDNFKDDFKDDIKDNIKHSFKDDFKNDIKDDIKDIIIEKKKNIILTTGMMANILINENNNKYISDKEKIIKIFKNNKDKDLK